MAVSSCDELETISETLIKEGDEAADFLVLYDKPTEELNEELKGKMPDLQDTIKRLSELGLSGHIWTNDDNATQMNCARDHLLPLMKETRYAPSRMAPCGVQTSISETRQWRGQRVGPSHHQQWVLFNRRVKILPRDWKYQVA